MQKGQLLGPIQPLRGLCQDDPLSPYLFILCAEVLSCLIQARVVAGDIHGCSVRQGASRISHMFFADGSILFFKAIEKEAKVVSEVLKDYEKASGQAVNFLKSLICYCPNTLLSVRNVICGLLQVADHDSLGDYLGLPIAIGRNKKGVFNFVKDKVWKRLNIMEK